MTTSVILLTSLLLLPVALGFSLLSYNIQHGTGFDGVHNLTRQAQVINSVAADIVTLQEVDNFTRRCPEDQLLELSKLTRLPHYAFGKQRDFEGGGYGIGILSRYPILRVEHFRFSPPTLAARFANRMPNNNNEPTRCTVYKLRDYCQGALAVQLVVPGQEQPVKLWVVTTHLGLEGVQFNETRQLVHDVIPELQRIAPAVPIVLTGDFNSEPHEANHKLILDANFRDTWGMCGTGGSGFTFDAKTPSRRIDFIYSQPELQCVQAQVPVTLASDHRPVLVKF